MAGNPWAATAAGQGAAGAATAPNLGAAGAGNPWSSAAGAVGSQQNPAQVADHTLGKDLGFVNQSGNPWAVAAAQHAANSTHQNPLLKALSFLDVPRSYAESALVHGAAALTGQSAELGGKSFVQDAQAHTNLGQYMARIENDPNSNLAKFLGGNAGDHKTLNTILGTIGDIGADPLNYVGLGEVGKAAAVAGHITDAVTATQQAERAASLAAELGTPEAQQAAADAAAAAAEKTGHGTITADTAVRLQKGGIAALTDPEKSLLGVKTGIRVGTATHNVKFGAALTDPVQSAMHNLSWNVGNTDMLRGLADKLVPNAALKGQIRDAALAGDGEAVARLSQIGREMRSAHGAARTFLNGHSDAFLQAWDAVPKGSEGDAVKALEGDTAAEARVTAAGGDVGPLRDAYQNVRADAAQRGVQMGDIQNYFPHQLTEAARQAAVTSAGRSGRAFTGELARSLKQGGEFLGQPLHTGSIDEINGIAQQVFGKDAHELFNTDGRTVTANYLRGLAHRVGEQHFANRLDELGVTSSGDLAKTPADWESLGASGAQAGQVAPPYVKEALDRLAEHKATPGSSVRLLRSYDNFLNTWKAYQLIMPGKAIRHVFAGPIWNSYLGGVKQGAAREGMAAWRTYMKAGGGQKGLAALPADMAKEVADAERYGIFHGRTFNPGRIDGTATTMNPLKRNFVVLDKNSELQARGQDFFRMAMYHDAIKKGMAPAEAAQKVRTMLGDPHNITEFERGTARRVVPFYCVPDDHEALTRRGWKKHHELVVGEDIMVLDPTTHEMRWEPLLEVATFDYDGPLRRLTRNGHNFLFTDNHRWPVETGRCKVKGKWYGGDRKVVEAWELNSNHRLPLVGEFSETASVLDDRLAAILGWVVTDGTARWRGSHWEAVVYQAPSKFLDEIIGLLGTRPHKPHPETGVVAVPVALADKKAITAVYQTKADLPALVCQLSRSAAEAMWQAMFAAEGSTSPKGQQHFAQNPGPVLEAFQILSAMTGRAAWVSARGAYVRKGRFVNAVDKALDGTEQYTGTVWCPRTPTGTWVMRHEGAVIPTGNTFLRQNLPVELKALATQPQKFVNAYESPKREVENNSPRQSVVPQLFGDSMSIRLPWNIGGNQVYLSPDLPFTRIGGLFGGRNMIAGQTSPLIQDAIAYTTHANPYTGAQFNTTAKTAPSVPVLKQIVEALTAAHVPGFDKTVAPQTDFGQTTPAGTYRVSPQSMYMLESLLPPFSQARRADATEPSLQSRQATTVLSDLVGQNFRTNDPAQQAGELYRRDAEIKKLVEHLQNTGVLPGYLKGFKK